MKTNNEICHEFAQGYKESSRGGNIFFVTESDGSRILYSYGRHFAIAKITPSGTCFFTTRYYSATTAKHVSNARGALAHYTLVFCAYPDAYGPRTNFDAWENELKQAEQDLARDRNKSKYTGAILHTLAQVRAYCNATGDTVPEFVAIYETIARTETPRPEAVALAMQAREDERRARIAREERAREYKQQREARERAYRMTNEERVQAWERGENVFLSWSDTEENVPLRVEARKGYQIIKTGKGVAVTIEAARRFYHALCAGEIHTGARIDTGATYYTAGEITPETVRVGCHTWKREYLDRFYKVIETL